jgi:hypothetical protein
MFQRLHLHAQETNDFAIVHVNQLVVANGALESVAHGFLKGVTGATIPSTVIECIIAFVGEPLS